MKQQILPPLVKELYQQGLEQSRRHEIADIILENMD